jgi:hypothetical protein
MAKKTTRRKAAKRAPRKKAAPVAPPEPSKLDAPAGTIIRDCHIATGDVRVDPAAPAVIALARAVEANAKAARAVARVLAASHVTVYNGPAIQVDGTLRVSGQDAEPPEADARP